VPEHDRPATVSRPADRETAAGCLKGVAAAVLAIVILAGGVFAAQWLFSRGTRPAGDGKVEGVQSASPSPVTFTGYVLDYEKRSYYNLLVLTDEDPNQDGAQPGAGKSKGPTKGKAPRLEVECRLDSGDTSPFRTTRGEKVTVVGIKIASDRGRVTMKNCRVVPNP
jgi:hypothetical protein